MLRDVEVVDDALMVEVKESSVFSSSERNILIRIFDQLYVY